jgi:hypothetical protein
MRTFPALLTFVLCASCQPQASPPSPAGPAGEAPPAVWPPGRHTEPRAPDHQVDVDRLPGVEASPAVRERLMRWAAGGASQAELGTILGEVLVDARTRDIQAVLVELGRRHAEFRPAWDEGLLRSLRSLASPERMALWERVDARYLPPLLEALLDLGDDAAVIRIAGRYAGTPHARVLQDQAALAGQRRDARPATLRWAAGCTVRLNGGLLPPGTLEAPVAAGTHGLQCEESPDAPMVVVEVAPGSTRLLDAALQPVP